MAPHSSTLAWKLPWTEEPGRLQSMGSHRVRHDWRDLAAAMQETWIRSPGWEDLLGKKMATHCSIFARRIPWTEEPGGLQSTGSRRVEHSWARMHACSVCARLLLQPMATLIFLLFAQFCPFRNDRGVGIKWCRAFSYWLLHLVMCICFL